MEKKSLTKTKKIAKKKINVRKLPELNYHVYRFSDYQFITNTKKTKMFVYANLVNAIQYSIKNNEDKAELCVLRGTNSKIIIEKPSWKKSLTKALHFFTEIELFETCSMCRDLIAQL